MVFTTLWFAAVAGPGNVRHVACCPGCADHAQSGRPAIGNAAASRIQQPGEQRADGEDVASVEDVEYAEQAVAVF